MSWPTAEISEVFDVARGGSPRPIQNFLTTSEDGVNWIMIGDASNSSKYISTVEKRITREGAKRSRHVEEGDFLLTNSMSFGRPYIMKTSGCIHDGWLVLKPKSEDIDSEFFYHLLGSAPLYREFSKRAAGAVVKNLNADLVRRVRVPVPTLAEQKRIARILDAADALRAKRRESIAQLDALVQSTFLEMFGDPVSNPMGWKTRSLDALLESVEGGWSPKCQSKPAACSEWGVLKLGAVTWCSFDESAQKALPEGVPARANLEIKAGDLLFARKNTFDLVAATAYVHEVRPKLMFPDLVFRLKPKLSEGVNGIFLWQLLVEPRQRGEIRNLASGAAGSMPNISKAKLKAVEVIAPPLELQERFASRVHAVVSLKGSLRTHLTELDTLFASLQSRAFAGKL